MDACIDGYHEMEFTSGDESELHKRKQKCQKNPGHLEFIPATKFTVEHLPECWRDILVFDCITALISLTVRVVVTYTSKDRPPNYPLYNRRGRDSLTAYGSGKVYDVSRKFSEKDGSRCPCKACKQTPHLAKTHWGEFAVHTACHVVFDSSEVRYTKCDLFFDSDEDRYTCPSLEGVEVVHSDIKTDGCWMRCITHDEDVFNKLEETVDQYWRLEKEWEEKYRTSEQVDKKNTSVVISHPHGLSKHVTVGKVTHTAEHASDQWKYSAETCRGSSGGYVYILWDRVGSCVPSGPWRVTHSGCQQKDSDKSEDMAEEEKAGKDGVNSSSQPNHSQGQDQKTDKLTDLQLAHKDQGCHEMEFTSSNESELHERKERCQKNPGHLEFIPVTEFSIDHLPECWHDSLVFDYINVLIGLTVRLAIKYTSKNRPPNYPLYKRRGQYGLTAYGSGMVTGVQRKFTEMTGDTCPCKTCQLSPQLAKTQWGEFLVDTACHVVFDSSEAKHARCDLFFDRDEDRSTCPVLEGVGVEGSKITRDGCWMRCVIHDEEVCNKLEEMDYRYNKLRDKMNQKYKASEPVDRTATAVVISHPHGLCKYVTVGMVTHIAEHISDKWKYTAETCPGSSGGTVCILGNWSREEWLAGPPRAAHSAACHEKRQNESTDWWW